MNKPLTRTTFLFSFMEIIIKSLREGRNEVKEIEQAPVAC